MLDRRHVLALLPAGLAMPAAAHASPRRRDGDDPTAEEVMRGLKEHLKQLVQTILDPTAESECLRLLAEMQELVLGLRLQPPPGLDAVTEEERAAHAKGFRVFLVKAAAVLLQAELDLLEGLRDAARAKLTGPLVELRDAAHERYKPRRW